MRIDEVVPVMIAIRATYAVRLTNSSHSIILILRMSSHSGPRRSRWGDKPPSSNEAVGGKAPVALTAAVEPSCVLPSVSDHDAVAALLAEAQAREKEKQAQQQQQRRRPQPPSSDRPSKRPRSSERTEVEQPEQPPSQDDADTSSEKPKTKANFGLSGALLQKDQNHSVLYKGVLLKFQEPPEARAPNTPWRFYVFKENELLETLHISRQSAYLIGRNAEICDIHVAHPSCSVQHAVLQYRALPQENGKLLCKPYIMDLESTNGTHLNGVLIEPARYYELRKGDVVKFGASTREYVLLTADTTSLSS